MVSGVVTPRTPEESQRLGQPPLCLVKRGSVCNEFGDPILVAELLHNTTPVHYNPSHIITHLKQASNELYSDTGEVIPGRPRNLSVQTNPEMIKMGPALATCATAYY